LNLVEKYTLQSVSFKPLLKTSCKVKDCTKDISCKGFCKKHYNDFFKNRRDFEGNCIKGYLPKIKNAKCRFPNCGTVGNKKNCLRKGLCNKHRKWAEKKIIDFHTCEILDPKRIPKEKEWYHCKVSKCLGKHKALGFCSNHYRSYKYNKTIDKNGHKIGFKLTYDKNSKCKFLGCTNKGRFVRGFCRLHYRQFTDKIIDQDGFKLNGLKRIYRYPEGAKCRGEGCLNKPKQNWFCNSCSSKIKFGSLTSDGKKTEKHIVKNKGKRCSHRGCKIEAKTKGLCMSHYNKMRYPKQTPIYKNVGHKCTISGCNKKAYCRAMCISHYSKQKRIDKGLNVKGLNVKGKLNKDSFCRVDCCENKAYSKMLCSAHYSYFVRRKELEIIQDTSRNIQNILKNNIIINKKLCKAVGCKKEPTQNNLCSNHFSYFEKLK